MSDRDLQDYISQMLRELAELADGRADDPELGTIAFKLRLLAGKPARSTVPRSLEPAALH